MGRTAFFVGVYTLVTWPIGIRHLCAPPPHPMSCSTRFVPFNEYTSGYFIQACIRYVCGLLHDAQLLLLEACRCIFLSFPPPPPSEHPAACTGLPAAL